MESNHVRDLMEAYSSIYTENEEVEQLDEFAPGLQGPVDNFLNAGQKVLKGLGLKVNEKERPTPDQNAQKAKINQNQNQSFDLFDIIKGHLLDEGFADTEEAALAIMTNMSEEWREQILDEATIRSVTSPSGKRIYKSPEYSSDERTNIRKTAHQQKRLKQRHYASTSDARDDQRSFEHDERQEKKKRKHPTNIMNAKPGESEHYGADEGDGYHYDTVKTDRNARKRRASGR